MPTYKTYTEQELRQLARAAAAKHGIDPTDFEAQIQQESGYKQAVVQGKRKSSAGALGVAQFMPRTAKSLGVDPLDPAAALDASAAYMASLSKKFGGDETIGRLAYNWGEGNVAKWLRNPSSKKVPKEAAEYNAKIAAIAGKPAPVLAGLSQGNAAPKPTPQQIEQASLADERFALQEAGAEIDLGLPPGGLNPGGQNPTPQQVQDPVAQQTPDLLPQQAAAPAPDTSMSWLDQLQNSGSVTALSGTLGANTLGTEFLDRLQSSAARSQDTALASMFSDTPGLNKDDGPELPGAVDRYLNKLLA